ncbi:MAG TPA: phosphate ABC transporter permease PstA [Micromonosporaceae bacterium]|jgi:phosphate transport system permease protein
MTAATRPAPAGATGSPVDLTRRSLLRRRRLTNRVVTSAIALAPLIALVPLGLVTYTVISKGFAVMSSAFLSSDVTFSSRRLGGVGPAIQGTLLITALAALIAIPLGVFGAIYLNEYGKQNRLARVIRTTSDVMTGVPSIVMGLFIYVSWVLLFDAQSGLAAALALACLMLPVVIRSSEEMLRLVPDELRQASLALGARKWRTTVTVVLPAAISGITSGSLLAIARAAGETAPIVLVIGLVAKPEWNLLQPNVALPQLIYSNASSPFPIAQDRAWGAALTLIVIVLVTTIIARFVANRYAIKER